jgi:hypothetical protein
LGLGALGMNREQLKTVLELFRTNVLTEDQTIDIIMGNNSYKGRPRGHVDTSDPVKSIDREATGPKRFEYERGFVGDRSQRNLFAPIYCKGVPKRLHDHGRRLRAFSITVSNPVRNAAASMAGTVR